MTHGGRVAQSSHNHAAPTRHAAVLPGARAPGQSRRSRSPWRRSRSRSRLASRAVPPLEARAVALPPPPVGHGATHTLDNRMPGSAPSPLRRSLLAVASLAAACYPPPPPSHAAVGRLGFVVCGCLGVVWVVEDWRRWTGGPSWALLGDGGVLPSREGEKQSQRHRLRRSLGGLMSSVYGSV